MEKLHTAWLSLKANRKSTGTAAAALAAGLVLLALMIGTAIGRYQTQLKSEASVRAMAFYFTSDLLDGETHTLAPGSTEITFTLSNHADDLRFSEMDIRYAVTATAEGGAAAPNVEYIETEQKLVKDTKQDHEVTIKNLEPGIYTVTATGTGGFKKTLTATIRVLSDEAQIYQHRDFAAEYTLLTVWNEGETEETVQITYTGIPDNTNPNMTNWLAGGPRSESVEIGAHESKVFRFFGGAGTANVTDKIPN